MAGQAFPTRRGDKSSKSSKITVTQGLWSTPNFSPTIELVVEYIEHNGTMELIKYASYWAQQAGLAITVTQTNHGDATEDCFRGIIDRNPQGVIMQQMGGLDHSSEVFVEIAQYSRGHHRPNRYRRFGCDERVHR